MNPFAVDWQHDKHCPGSLQFGFGVLVNHRPSGHWVRAWISYGEAPGTHWGLWRSRLGDRTGDLRGWNLRFGRNLNQCVTMLAHRGHDTVRERSPA